MKPTPAQIEYLRRRLRLGVEMSVSTNIYTRRFIACCPNNGASILYTLSIETTTRLIPVEEIVRATDAIRTGFHEAIADQLHGQFGGRQTLIADHHGVGIETIRGAA